MIKKYLNNLINFFIKNTRKYYVMNYSNEI